MKTIDSLLNHCSVRNFKDEPLSQATKNKLLQAARAGSSSNFVQATSIIEVTNQTERNEIAEISNNAPYVKQSGAFFVFIADLYRQAKLLDDQHMSLEPLQNVESLLVSVTDTAIAAENMAVAAESLGLGICFIGGIRNDLTRVAELLQLPKYTVPFFGLTIGVPATKNSVKPRMPLHNFVADNTYDRVAFTQLAQYDITMHDYYQHRSSHAKNSDWSQSQREFFSLVRRPDVSAFLQKQGLNYIQK